MKVLFALLVVLVVAVPAILINFSMADLEYFADAKKASPYLKDNPEGAFSVFQPNLLMLDVVTSDRKLPYEKNTVTMRGAAVNKALSESSMYSGATLNEDWEYSMYFQEDVFLPVIMNVKHPLGERNLSCDVFAAMNRLMIVEIGRRGLQEDSANFALIDCDDAGYTLERITEVDISIIYPEGELKFFLEFSLDDNKST